MLIHKSSPKLYKLDSKGELRVWWVEVYVDGLQGFLSTSHGLHGGAITTTQPQVVSPTNVGKKNQRNSVQQAEFEYDALIQKKLRERYTTDPTGVLEAPPPKAMLAHEYKKYKDKVFENDTPVYLQPKLDGIRCLANKDGLWTRGGKLIVSCPHLLEPIKKLLELLPDGSFLDGELYNHQYHDKFQSLVSLIRKQNVTKETLAETEAVVQYHIYDVSGTEEFSVRWENFRNKAPSLKHIHYVETKTALSPEDIEDYHELCLNADYEGSIIRWGTKPYEEKRSKHLLKYKDFDDAEFIVHSIEEGKGDWQGAVKRFILFGPDVERILFGAGVRGDREVLSDMWKKQERPDWATVRYFGVTDAGIPRFPVVTDWGWNERTD